MASPCSKSIFVFFLCCSVIIISATAAEEEKEEEGPIPIPTPWPHQFHSIFFINASDKLQIIDLWYDWPNGRNLNIIQDQLGGPPLYSLEWNNGTSFFYTLADPLHCFSAQFDVGILRPDWIVTGANYLGQRLQDGFLCNVWEKADYFITYYEDVLTRRPVFWLLFTGKVAHALTFEVGAALEDAKWQVPSYCFENNKSITPTQYSMDGDGALRGSMLF